MYDCNEQQGQTEKSMSPRLPPELIELIISNIQDPDTLASCGLVHTSFSRPSRVRLFRTISLTKRRSDSLLALLSSSYCSLPGLVKQLKLIRGLDRPPDLDPILTALGTVTSLIVEVVGVRARMYPTPPLIQRPPTPAFSLVTTLDIRGVRFETFGSAIEFVCSFSELQTLIMFHVSWEKPSMVRAGLECPSSLRTLRLFSNLCILNWVLRSSVPMLSTLIIGDVTYAHTRSVCNLVTAVQDSLRHLTVSFLPNEDSAEAEISSHPALDYIPQLYIVRSSGPSIIKM